MADFQKTIERCSERLSGRTLNAGIALRTQKPLLSVFIGSGAIRHRTTVERAYKDCWGPAVENLEFVDSGMVDVQTISSKSINMLANVNAFHNNSALVIAWYWDIMEDDPRNYFENMLAVSKMFPQGIHVEEYFFVFCRQWTPSDRAITTERLKMLAQWAAANEKSLIVQSDVTYGGLFNESNRWKSYRGAANMIVIINTVNSDAGVQLAFNVQRGTMWSIGCHTMNKNTREIAIASLYQLLREYKSAHDGADMNDYADIKTRIGADTGYPAFFTRLINEWKLMPGMPNCIPALPYTPEMEAFYAAPTVKHSFFKRNAPSEIDQRKLESAIGSIRDFWEAFLNKYYRASLNSLEQSDDWMEKRLMNMLAKQFRANEMNSAFKQEAAELRKIVNWPVRTEKYSTDPTRCLHEVACNQLKNDLYKNLATRLANALDKLSESASGFGSILEAVEHAFRNEEIEESIKLAYGNHMHDLISRSSDDVVNIHPCGTIDELYQQLEDIFYKLTEHDPVYKYSLQQDISFRMAQNGGQMLAANIIQDFFDLDMSQTGALRTYSMPDGAIYCLMNNSEDIFNGQAMPNMVGKVFNIPGADYIDRLIVYPVDPNQIMY